MGVYDLYFRLVVVDYMKVVVDLEGNCYSVS